MKYHEGLPIAILEAMSCGVPVLVSDIRASKEVGLPLERYFRCGDVDDLKNRVLALLNRKITKEEWKDMRGLIENEYSRDRIAEQTIEVYRKAARND